MRAKIPVVYIRTCLYKRLDFMQTFVVDTGTIKRSPLPDSPLRKGVIHFHVNELGRLREHQSNSLCICCLKFCLPTFNKFPVHRVSLL